MPNETKLPYRLVTEADGFLIPTDDAEVRPPFQRRILRMGKTHGDVIPATVYRADSTVCISPSEIQQPEGATHKCGPSCRSFGCDVQAQPQDAPHFFETDERDLSKCYLCGKPDGPPHKTRQSEDAPPKCVVLKPRQLYYSSVEPNEQQPEQALDEARRFKVVVNATEHTVDGSTISYDDVVTLAGRRGAKHLTVTYCQPSGNTGGSLIPGEFISLRDGLIFCAMNTSNA